MTKVTICACIGPAYGEPFCYCEMVEKGLPLNEEARAEDRRRLDEALIKIINRRKDIDGPPPPLPP